MAKTKKASTDMEKLADKAKDILKGKHTTDITKADFNKAIKKATKPKGRSTK